MLGAALLVTTMVLSQTVQPTSLPATPQGKHVQAYLDAFNTGDVKTYLAMMDEHMDPSQVKKRTVEERTEMFKRIQGDFGTFKASKVLEASAERIRLTIPDKEGTEATFTFTFESKPPHRIAGISIDIDS